MRRDEGQRAGEAAAGGFAEASATGGRQSAVPPGVTPSMAQFLEIKAANPGCLLFYRMGDFYELFFDDAITAAEALGIVLTKRGKHLGEDIPMCGVPVHRSDEYLQRLIASGFRVAVCEQMEDPAAARKRGSKAVVHRDVVRLVTPGTLTEDSLLDARARNYLTAIAGVRPSGSDTKASFRAPKAMPIALASLDISTGELEVGEVALADLAGEIVRLGSSEVIAADAALADPDVAKAVAFGRCATTPVPAATFDSLAGERQLKTQLGIADLAAFGAFSKAELAAVGALLKYVELTQIGRKPCLRPPRRSGSSQHLIIDAATRASLELTRSTSGDRKASLLAAIDRTVTGPGARELTSRLASPLVDVHAIGARLDAVEMLREDEALREDLRRALRHTSDLARAMARLALQRGGPRDLGAVRDALATAQTCAELLRKAAGAFPAPGDQTVDASRNARPIVPSPGAPEARANSVERDRVGGDSRASKGGVPPTPDPSPQGGGESGRASGKRGNSPLPGTLALITERLAACDGSLQPMLTRAVVDDPPHLKRDGGFVREGYSADLDQARSLRDDGRKVMAALEAKYIQATGIKALKVRHNNILGYYIEVPAGAARPLTLAPLNEMFRHRQTMAGAMRFTTEELRETESRIVSAADRALTLEQDIFAELAAAIAAQDRALGEVAGALADLDCEAGLAEVAAREGYTRPVLDDSTAFEIVGGRHPVVEQALRSSADGGQFIENDCRLTDGLGGGVPCGSDPMNDQFGGALGSDLEGPTPSRLWLVTGPNMAGKSTFLRQNALIVVLAQMGAFVPARAARIGIVDRLFSRVGAADDLARGRSTFMVEMVETAGILNQATPRSLVILDEIGRGTATFDGLSIAWAVVEYLSEVSQCRALFATHYHELTALAGRLPEVACVTMEVAEWKDEIRFLHHVKSGAADRSYGIQVAKLAGLPAAVTRRAGQVLALLEKGNGKATDGAPLLEELPLFAAAGRPHAAAAGFAEDAGSQEPKPSPLQMELADVDPDELTPKEALEVLYRLKKIARRE
ncbi:MAG TPA: DNA mismatch repair protein MutS [Hyphomicrobiaceae bacterium]|nr:DNA mismatch repair protein MutS [Hyphomicrobiaceae bacterium]